MRRDVKLVLAQANTMMEDTVPPWLSQFGQMFKLLFLP